jgi:hypothetical protein
VAQYYCKAFEVEYKPFYHPQYWKRFKSKHPYELISYLKEVTREDVHH